MLSERAKVSIRSNIGAYLERSGVPSVAITIARNGQIIWEEGFGWADKEQQIQSTPATVYQVGSITKSFTATVMMILAVRGLADLNKPVNDYLCGAKLRGCWIDPSEATVSRLLLHTAGLQNYWNSYYPMNLTE